MNIKSIFASSVDPSKISLTIESLSKVAIYGVTYYAVSKGFSVETATTQVQAITDLVLQLVPTVFALYHGVQAIYGLVRKVFVAK